KPPTADSIASHEAIAQQLNTLPIMYPEMTEPLQRSPHHPMGTVIQLTSVFTPNMIKRNSQLRPKTIVSNDSLHLQNKLPQIILRIFIEVLFNKNQKLRTF
ncbi:hypothetical protein Golomagni_07855, partial [Golovinomyces magnicellulatus]